MNAINETIYITRPEKGRSLLTALQDFVVIDVETTGLCPAYDEMIEVGAIRYRGGKPEDSFTSLIKPRRKIDPVIEQLTGITNEMVESAPPLRDVLPDYLNFIGADVVVGHNVNFDVNFIYDACKEISINGFGNDFVDTLRLSRRMYNDLPNHKLDTIVEYFHIAPRDLHRSLKDCELTAACYLNMMQDKERFQAAAAEPVRKPRPLRQLLSSEDVAMLQMEADPDSPFYGKVCVFTGELERFTRKDAALIVTRIGGIFGDSVTKKTNYLILGNNDYCASIKDGKSTKQKKAEALILKGADLQIIPESVFLEMLQMD